LGTGGLIRAYGGSARLVLREAPVVVLIPKSTFQLCVDSSYVGSVYESVAKVSGLTSSEIYGADGTLRVTVTCDLEYEAQLQKLLSDATRGSVVFSYEPSVEE
jgi:putative IMPACT (imprinted ancient) family translation regulator